ncbi:aldo/keto reductase [Lysobacter hankyongensis]|uniref:Aldo/keto reductase family oxidoreductase n=1 Tax=Lysobacter hankyongensis TaxID=1176535 RepID=A0ABP9B9V4_9GAMM
MPKSSPILGSMRFGEWGARLSPVAVADLLEAALDAGIDTLDLADIYGGHSTNALVGAAFAVRPGLRARLKLIAKIGIVMAGSPGNARGVQHYDLSVEHLRRALDDSLSALGVDRVDTLMLHRFDPLLRPDAIAAWIRDEQRAGRVGDFGVSNFDAHAIALFDGRLPVSANQIELSLANAGAIDDGTLNATRARGAEVQAWSPLGGGDLLDPHSAVGGRVHARLQAMAGEFGLDPASLLLRWVASVPDTRVVLGSTKIERLREGARVCAEPLPRDAWYALWEAARGRPVP